MLVDGELVWFLERGGRSLLSFADDDSDANHAAAVALADLVSGGRVNSILIERINSAPVLAPQVLVDGGRGLDRRRIRPDSARTAAAVADA